MTKRIVRRRQASDDIESAAEHYLSVADEATARDFTDALRTALRVLADNPGLGSPRYGEQLGLAGLRHWPLKRFPYLIMYIDRPDHIDVWRILHATRDISASLREKT